MQEWLENIALAFAHQSMPLAHWLPIVDAGLEGLTVGVIPPVLDQVLIGAIDRSRNPDLQRIFILGMNEGVFPAAPASPALLTNADRELLHQRGCELGPDLLQQLGHERFYGYIACTRARSGVALTSAAHDAEGKPLNSSLFFQHLQRLIPGLTAEAFSPPSHWVESEHACEIIGPLLIDQAARRKAGVRGQPALPAPSSVEGSEVEGGMGADSALDQFRNLPVFAATLERLRHLHAASDHLSLDPTLAEKLYGDVLHTSVSSLEKFAACPFRFFVDSGLEAEEREQFILDPRQQGSFQHEILARFHQRVLKDHGAWRNIAPAAARQLIQTIAEETIPEFAAGILTANDQNLFQARAYSELLGQFIEVIVAWFDQYQFDPVHVELPFGTAPLPGWEIDLENGHRLIFHGRIDRIDLWREPGAEHAACVVVDYKSSLRNVNEVLLEEGIQLQLPVYLNLLKHLADPREVFATVRLKPAGVFYINLRGKFETAKTRTEALASPLETRKAAYQHHGLFSFSYLPQLDNREVLQGDQFKYKLTKHKKPYKYSQGCEEDKFQEMLRKAEKIVRTFGQRIYEGDVRLDPYRQGNDVACDECDFKSICRIDPWEHRFRVLPTRRK
jgi:ATP-dependent helicase/nuclease subunit B